MLPEFVLIPVKEVSKDDNILAVCDQLTTLIVEEGNNEGVEYE